LEKLPVPQNRVGAFLLHDTKNHPVNRCACARDFILNRNYQQRSGKAIKCCDAIRQTTSFIQGEVKEDMPDTEYAGGHIGPT